MAIKIVASVLLLCGVASLCSGSAIPIWEFLSRDEKMSHLYSMLGKLVSDYCKGNSGGLKLTVAQCKHDLLGYGSGQLQKMSNHQLDSLDIFQRGAPELIWETVMKNHPSSRVSQSKLQSSTTFLPPPAMILGNPHNNIQRRNPLFDASNEKANAYAMGIESGYNYNRYSGSFPDSQNHLHHEANLRPTYLTGPHVVRVLPDGTPVEEDKHKPLPRDEDREFITVGRARYSKGHHQKHYRNSNNFRTQRN